jgi:hypothetical protein
MSVVIAIEAKVHSDWSYEKDIKGNEQRLRLIKDRMPPSVTFVHCLLLTKNKWDACERLKSGEQSNYRQLIESDDCRTRVILWEELLDLVDDKRVAKYVKAQLARPSEGFGYEFDGGWFIRDRRPPT